MSFLSALATVAAAGLFSTLVSPDAMAQCHENVEVVPLHQKVAGKTYGEWAAAWWQWVLAIPASVNPRFDTTGADAGEHQSGPVWFLAGNFGGALDALLRRSPRQVSVLAGHELGAKRTRR